MSAAEVGPAEQQRPDIEVTVGVEVHMTWDQDAERYVIDGMTTTAGGLFSEAETGVWVPDWDEWSRDDRFGDAGAEAWDAVKRILAAAEQD